MKLCASTLLCILLKGLLSNAEAAAIPQTTGWYSIPNTTLRSVCPQNNFGGTSYGFSSLCNGVVVAWNSAVFDSTRNRLVIWGGGHNDYAGNELYALDLDTETMTRLNNPSVPVNTSCSTTMSDGAANARHTYDGIEYMPNVDKMFVFGGSRTPCGGFGNDLWTFSFQTMTWKKIFENNLNSTVFNYPGPGAVSAYDPNTGKVFLHDFADSGGDLFIYDPVAETIQRVGSGTTIDYHMTAAIDPVRKKLVIIGGGQLVVYNIAPGSTYQATRPATTGGSTIIGAASPGIAYDPVSDRMVAYRGGDTVYSLNLDTNSWTSQTFAGGAGSAPSAGTFGRWQYSPTSGVFVAVNSVDANGYTLRLNAGGGSPPPPPPPPVFDFSLGNGGSRSVVAGSSVTNSITATLGSGTPQSVSFSVSGLPSGTSGSFSPGSCGPTCSTTLTIATSGSTPAGSSTVTVTGTAGSLTRTTTFTLTVDAVPPPSGPPPPPPTGQITAFQLTSAVSGTLPFTVGLSFRKGDIPGVPVLNIAESQVIVKSRWSDNSVKHAIASGRAALTAGTASTIGVSGAASSPGGTNLTAADIQSANPSGSVQLGSIGTVNLSSLLGSPFRTWISGPEMVEAHYRSGVGSDPTLTVWFHVRLHQGGRMFVRAVVENGYVDVSTGTKTYAPSVTIGGTTVYNNGGSSLTQYAHTRWTAEGWIGGDPQVTPRAETTYLTSTKLVPNYWQNTPSATALNSLYQNYVPMQDGNWTTDMGNSGFQSQIGLLPNWDALYMTSGGDARAFRSVLANSKALNTYPIVWNDSVTKLPTMPSNRPTWTVNGEAQGGETSISAGPVSWDVAHHGSGGYLAYLLTGDYFYLETMEDQAATCYLIYSAGKGSGTSRIMRLQTRDVAWCLRTIGQLAAVAPPDPIVNDYRALFSNNINRWNNERLRAGINQLGYLFSAEISTGGYGTGRVSPWQQHFWVQSYGYLSDIEPVSDLSTLNVVRDHIYKSVVGILGTAGTDQYCYTKASQYTLKISDTNSDDATTWYDSWGQVYQQTIGSANTACGNTLEGGSGGDPSVASTGYWGNLLPAISYAVDHGAPGAAASWNRMSSATNWSTFRNSGFTDTPVWGIVPRSPSPNPPPPTFDFSLGNGGNSTVNPGSSVTNSITANLLSGTAQAVSFSVSGLPSGATGSFSPASCTPTCSTTLTMSASGATVPGAYPVTVTGTAGSLTRTSSFTLTVNAPGTGTLQVGPGKPYSTIGAAVTAAQSGNTIEIDAGVYTETLTISKSNLTLRGVGGYAHLRWGTGNYQTNTSNIPNGKGIFVISGDNITLENIEFSGAKVNDQNGAGIRYEHGNLTIRGSYFHDNENGILGEGGSSSTLLIEHSTFARNGYCPSQCAHNLYIENTGRFIFRHNKSLDSREGHTIKSRAPVNEIIGNFFSTKNSNGSYEADFPNGGTVYFVGNVVEQGASSDNSSMLSYGAEGVSNPNPALYVINNTFYNYRGSGDFVDVSGSPVLSVKNNIFAGGGTMLSGPGTDLSSNRALGASAFVSSGSGNYRLVAGSAAIDAGVNPGSAGAFNLTPQWEYVEPAGKQARIVSGSAIDVGAYEFNSGTTPPVLDLTPPAISDVGASNVTSIGATIYWTTNEAADTQLEYGTSPGYGSLTPLNPALVIAHAQTLSGLASGTTYNYRVRSKDAAGNLALSANFTFTTTFVPDTTPPAISNVGASNVTSSGATIHWNTNEAADTQLEYGTSTAYGIETPLDSARVMSHIRTLSGLTAETTYHYRVKSRDAAGNLAVSANFSFATTTDLPAPPPPGGGGGGGSDNTPPAISITSPAGGTVAGMTLVSATATDVNGVHGVQFKLDGFNVGAEDTTPPFAINWDTLTTSNGFHAITGVARDAAGNLATSSPVYVMVDNSTMTYSAPEGGGQVWTVAGTDAQMVGSARIDPGAGTDTPAGMAIVNYRAGGVLITEASFPATVPVQSGRISVEINAEVNTGIAIANGGDDDATIQFYFTDAQQTEFGHGSLVLKANRQISAFLNSAPFFGRSFMEGSFTFVSTGAPVSVIAVRGFTNERGDFLFTTLPVSMMQAESAAALSPDAIVPRAEGDLPANALLVPHFADGGGWTTRVVLTNPTDQTLTGTLQFFDRGTPDRSGAPVPLVVNGSWDSSFAYTIPPRSSVKMVTGSASAEIQAGSVRVVPSGGPSPSVGTLYSFKQGGVTVTESSISAVSMMSLYRMYMESSGPAGRPGAIQPAIAIANPSSTPLAVTLDVRRLQDGVVVGSRSVTIPGGGQLSSFIHELFPELPQTYRATLQISASSGFAVAGLRGRYNERGDFLISTTPPTSDQAFLIGSRLLFPHVVHGGGYTTDLVLFSTTVGSTSGTVYFRTQEGVLQSGSRLQRQP